MTQGPWENVAAVIREARGQSELLQDLGFIQVETRTSTGKRKGWLKMSVGQDARIEGALKELQALSAEVAMAIGSLQSIQRTGEEDTEELVRRTRRLAEYYLSADEALSKVRSHTHRGLNEKMFPTSEELVAKLYPGGDFLRSGTGKTRPETEPLPRDIQDRFEERQQ